MSLVYHQLRSETTTKRACCSLVATRTTTNYERQPRSTNSYRHERCSVREVNFRASSYWYKYYLLTLPIPPAHQELILLSKTTISTTHGRGVVALVSKKNVNGDLMGPLKVKSLITKNGPVFGYVFVLEKTADHIKARYFPLVIFSDIRNRWKECLFPVVTKITTRKIMTKTRALIDHGSCFYQYGIPSMFLSI